MFLGCFFSFEDPLQRCPVSDVRVCVDLQQRPVNLEKRVKMFQMERGV